jgi:hypothetical protein
MSSIRKELTAFAALAALPTALPMVGPAGARPVPQQCMTHVLSAQEMRRGVHSEVTCYRTTTEMLAAAGADGFRDVLDVPLATHYVDANGSGDSLTVFGASCNGGGTNLTGEWNDSISSTLHQLCGRIKHFADANAGGDYQITTGGLVSLSPSMNDRTSSVYYYAS